MGNCIGGAENDYVFKVTNISDENLEPQRGLMEVTSTQLFYVDSKTEEIWPLKYLRKYGCDGDVFSFEAGRKCPGGEGLYAFSTKRASILFEYVAMRINVGNLQPSGELSPFAEPQVVDSGILNFPPRRKSTTCPGPQDLMGIPLENGPSPDIVTAHESVESGGGAMPSVSITPHGRTSSASTAVTASGGGASPIAMENEKSHVMVSGADSSTMTYVQVATRSMSSSAATKDTSLQYSMLDFPQGAHESSSVVPQPSEGAAAPQSGRQSASVNAMIPVPATSTHRSSHTSSPAVTAKHYLLSEPNITDEELINGTTITRASSDDGLCY